MWNQVDALQKHFKKDHVHMGLWTRIYGICMHCVSKSTCELITGAMNCSQEHIALIDISQPRLAKLQKIFIYKYLIS